MSDDNLKDLKEKYGRKNSNEEQNKTISENDNLSELKDENQYGTENTYTKKTKESLTQKEKNIKENIANVISMHTNKNQENKKNKEDSFLTKTIKAVIIFCILLTAAVILIAFFIVKPEVDFEGDQIIEQIKKTEDLYYAKTYKYHYFPKTNYDQTLGIDLSSCKYFTAYEVIPEKESGNYEARTYGTTNAFTMTYYYLKSLIKK